SPSSSPPSARRSLPLFHQCDADDGEPPRGVSGVQPLQLRHRGDARSTPRRPEVEQYDFALVVIQIDTLAVQVLQREPGRGAGCIGAGKLVRVLQELIPAAVA